MAAQGSVYLLYHFFHPDDVVSARLFSDLAVDLTAAGFDVVAVPSIRSCHGGSVRLSRGERWAGGQIRRVWRPDWPQHKNWGRFGNTLFMLIAWTWLALTHRRSRNEVMIVGTDPVLAVLVAISWRILRPRSRIIHWCHDLYPDAAVADGMIADDAWWVRLLRRFLAAAYRRCDVVVDLGLCMRTRLVETLQPASERDATVSAAIRPKMSRDQETVDDGAADSGHDWWSGHHATLVPWSLVEPETVVDADPRVREDLFGDCRLSLLYSGNFGKAHFFDSLLELARRLRGESIGFCFAGRGLQLDEVRAAMTVADQNIRFAGFADEADLAARLAAADIHLVTLRENWTGAVVPSKFFGALAAGRPVLFAGDPSSAIAGWITRYDIGWVLTADSLDRIVDSLRELAADPSGQAELRQRCFDVYHAEFSRRVQVSRWCELIAERSADSLDQQPNMRHDPEPSAGRPGDPPLPLASDPPPAIRN